jgi:hypothetical protein
MDDVERHLLADQPFQQHEIGQRLAEIKPRTQRRLREKASSWRTRAAARFAFCLICMMS